MCRELSCLATCSLHTMSEARTAILLRTRVVWEATLCHSEQQLVIGLHPEHLLKAFLFNICLCIFVPFDLALRSYKV